MILQMGVCCQGVQICKCGIVSCKYLTVVVGRFNLILQMGVCGQGIQICKCGIVSCKYVTVGVGRL